MPDDIKRAGPARSILTNLALLAALAVGGLAAIEHASERRTQAEAKAQTTREGRVIVARAGLQTAIAPPQRAAAPEQKAEPEQKTDVAVADARQADAAPVVAALSAPQGQAPQRMDPPPPMFETEPMDGPFDETAAIGDTAIEEGAEGLGPATAARPRARMRALFGALLRGESKGARSLAALASPQNGQLIADLLVWRRLTSDQGVDWEESRDFLERRPHWPRIDRIRAKAERAMPEGYPRDIALDFFEDAPPETARGARIYGEALIAAGREAEGRRWIVTGWRERTAPKSEEDLYLAKHAEIIEPYHEDRLELLLWRRQWSSANRQAGRLGGDHPALTEARIALMRSKRSAKRLLERVPATLRSHPGLHYARMVWGENRNRRSEAEDAMREASAAQDLGDPEAWADERLTFARDAFEKERYQDAFDFASAHGLEEGSDYAKLQWFAGWIALRFLDEPQAAIDRFEVMYEAVETPISRGRAAYWSARAAEAMGDQSRARRWYERGAFYPHSFYGQLCADALGRPPAFNPPRSIGFFRGGAWSAVESDLAAAAAMLYDAGLSREARRFLGALAERRNAPRDLEDIAMIARGHADAAGEIVVGKVGEGRGQNVWQALYPVPQQPDWRQRHSEPALLLGVARQESRFDRAAKSHAGASGLMQLMPRTAQWTAKRLGLSYSAEELTRSPSYNLTLGDNHMSLVLDYYGGSYVLAVAAYNAGQGNVDKWLKRFGDPRDPAVDVIDWMESIPFNETRNYVQRVLEATQVYRVLLDGDARAAALSADLARARRPEIAASPGPADPKQ